MQEIDAQRFVCHLLVHGATSPTFDQTFSWCFLLFGSVPPERLLRITHVDDSRLWVKPPIAPATPSQPVVLKSNEEQGADGETDTDSESPSRSGSRYAGKRTPIALTPRYARDGKLSLATVVLLKHETEEQPADNFSVQPQKMNLVEQRNKTFNWNHYQTNQAAKKFKEHRQQGKRWRQWTSTT